MTYLLLVVLGYALTRIIDLAIDWHRSRLLPRGEPAGPETHLSATARQRLLERRAVYARFRSCVNEAVEAAVNQGHGSYGMLYQIRDAYGDLLRHAPTTITHAADSVIRCVTLLVNLGPSDQRYAMFTRALKLFDEECECDHGLKISPGAPHHIEYSVLGGEASSPPVASPKENGSGSVRAPT